MYLYLGGDIVVDTKDVVGIFDLDNTSVSHLTRHYLSCAQKSGRIVEVSSELPKSFVVCQKKKKITVYLSQMAPSTLKKRSDYMKEIVNL